MAPRFLSLARELRAELAAIEPARFTGEDCAFMAEAIAATEKACAAARARLAARAADCGEHRKAGFRDPEDWLARMSGSSAPKARSDLNTARRLDDCDKTKQAVLDGDLSLDEADEITRTEADCPGSEDELLGTAKREGLRNLRDKARKKRQEAADPDELRRKQERAREFGGFVDELGMVRIRGALLPEIGIPFLNRIDAEANRLRKRAKTEGRDPELRSAYAHDAFAAMLANGGKGKAKSADMVVVCDLRAYRRGHAHDGEPCHILEGGRIPVSLAKKLAEDAFLKVVLHDGVEIATVCHLGRHRPAHLRTALELGPPPDFDGVTCSVPGCGRRHGLEWDHEDPVANQGPTSYENLNPRCWPHHQEKTAADRRAGLLDGVIARLEERAPP